MPKLIVMPPLDDLHRSFAVRLANDLPGLRVVAPETLDDARRELLDADAAFGWIPPELLPLANRLRWLQNPDAGPRAGYFYPALIEHPVVICNPARHLQRPHLAAHHDVPVGPGSRAALLRCRPSRSGTGSRRPGRSRRWIWGRLQS